MVVKAYILAADPAWLEQSVLSYYGLVDEIVVSYDQSKRGWTGNPIELDECLDRLCAIDRDHKMRMISGDFVRLGLSPMENDTRQRQSALDAASPGADWVLQLDTDEVVASPSVFCSCLHECEARGFHAMDYPARWLYRSIGGGRFLEWRGRFWRTMGTYPGPVAVKSGTRLKLARQCEAPLYRVDFRRKNTNICLARDAAVHRVVRPDEGIYHFSWVRDEQKLRRKFKTWSHARDRDWDLEVCRWIWAGKHPLLASLLSPFARSSIIGYLGFATLPATI